MVKSGGGSEFGGPVEEVGGWKTCRRSMAFYASNADDRHYMVDWKPGRVTFETACKDCRRKSVGAYGPRVSLWRWRSGQCPPKAISKLTEVLASKSASLRAHGGGASETMKRRWKEYPASCGVTSRRYQRRLSGTALGDAGR